MMRTKHLIFAFMACAVLVISAHIFSVEGNMSASVLEARQEAVFSNPQDAYRVVTQNFESKGTTRDAFIDRVRTALSLVPVKEVEEPTPEPQPEPVVIDEVVIEASLPIATIVEPIVVSETQSTSTIQTIATGTATHTPQLAP